MASPGAPPIAVSQGHFAAGASATERDGEKTPPPMLNDAQSRQNTLSPCPETPGGKDTGNPHSPAPTNLDSLPPKPESGNGNRPAASGTTKDAYYFKMHGSTFQHGCMTCWSFNTFSLV